MPDPMRTLIDTHVPSMVRLRRDLHAHPELMFEERRTSEVVASELESMRIEHRAGLAAAEPGGTGTGVVAFLPATESQSARAESVALRADMDALPIAERTGVAHTSVHEGVMHACGHDGHTAMLLGAARVLSELKYRPNPVTFLFQPAEEGGAGGEKMCRDGALGGSATGGVGTPVARVFGLHGWPQLPLGTVATRPGPMLAATDEFDVIVRGTQSHAAYPHLGADPIAAGAQIVSALQTVVARNVAPTDPAVVTVGRFHAGTANNVIPAEARLTGTVRSFRDETRELLKHRFYGIVQGVAAAMGCEAEIDWHEGYPVTRNDPVLASHVLGTARSAFGPERVLTLDEPTLGGEDFSFYGQHVPTCFAFLGLHGGGPVAHLHQPEFDFNDDAIPLGVELLCRLALAEDPASPERARP